MSDTNTVVNDITFQRHSGSPYISIEFPDCKDLIDPNEIVIPMKEIEIVYDYPLNNKVIFSYTSKCGFSRVDLIRLVCNTYKDIYNAEDAAVGDPGLLDNLYNRAPSYGPYGIKWHYITDLLLHSVKHVEGNLFSLGIES